jgi:hypothetical protein
MKAANSGSGSSNSLCRVGQENIKVEKESDEPEYVTTAESDAPIA